ncbi:hypothetical protein [Streptomyces sp. ALI-76-A]|uniref:hypothetical protein n=1 Tax=Streptomyces sp. ALI-76-A TaxID=3025736 RepID=UPI00256F4603|nr:hypothetical protein [Streptomyces sp. ALI-76-A]MDL5199538.1 hypothetical protein [Streptomyces sp. ALI-76-A]
MSAAGAEMNYPPVRNGMDYLRSVVAHLDREEPDERDLKYGVLHLQAATEVLLKALLVSFDWRQVFTKPDEADELAYRQGDFTSCKIDDAIKRLRARGVEIAPEDKAHITALAKQRNRLQHFGLTATAPAIEARAAQVLDFLIAFVNDHLRPGLTGAEAQHLDQQMYHVRQALPRIRGYSSIIMDRIKPELAGLEWYTLRCPDCLTWALLAEGGEVRCLFCETDWDAEAFPSEYAAGVLGHSWSNDGTESDLAPPCPECGAEALIGEAYLAAAPEQAMQYCFGCSREFQGLESCLRCSQLYQQGEDHVAICNDCLGSLG